MGASGAICVFDHARFLREVVPALRAGERHPLIAREIEKGRGGPGFDLGDFEGLAAAMTHFTSDLTGAKDLGRMFTVRDGVLRTDHDWSRASGTHISARSTWNYGSLCDLFERLVTRHCISHFAHIGTSYRITFTINDDTQGLDDVTAELVRLLDEGATYWAPGTGGYGEGITGWLDAEECALFAEAVPTLSPGELEHDVEDARARIDTIARTARVAAELSRGLLWGIDLAVLYDRWQEYDGGEHQPIALGPRP